MHKRKSINLKKKFFFNKYFRLSSIVELKNFFHGEMKNFKIEWANKPLRFYIYGHKCVSKRDKKVESVFKN